MKKSLIALAVMAASGAAMAQSSVSVYGIADIWVGSVKQEFNGESERNSKVDSGGVNTSRIGFKGTEDLGGGLKANFLIETSIGMDEPGGTKLGDRNAYVGLSGGFGEVQLGRTWSSYDDIRSSANDNFNANVAASFQTWVGYNDKVSNSIKYISPEFAGFSGSLTYGFGEDKADNTNGKASSLLSVGLQYANGPLFVGFAHQTEKAGNKINLGALGNGEVLFGLTGIYSGSLTEPLKASAGSKATYNLLNGSYDFGVAKLVAGYNEVKVKNLTVSDSTTPAANTFSVGTLKAQEWNIGAEVPLATALSLGVGYAQSTIEQAGQDIAKSTGYTATLLYSLSKRTTVYGALSQAKLKDKVGLGNQDKVTLYAVGLNHKF